MATNDITSVCTVCYIDGDSTVVTKQFNCYSDAMQFVKHLRALISEGNTSIRGIALQDRYGRWLRFS